MAPNQRGSGQWALRRDRGDRGSTDGALRPTARPGRDHQGPHQLPLVAPGSMTFRVPFSRIRYERKIVFRQFAAMRDIDLRCASSEDRRRLLEALRVLVELDKDGNARISGMFDTEIVELLPMVQHLRDEARHDKPYRRHFRYEVPPEHNGVITLDTTPIAGCSPSPTTS